MTTRSPLIENPKEHFILNDSFNNIAFDVDFSIFRKYMCKAGCKICYVQDDWLDNAAFKKHIPIKTAEKSYIDRLMNFFSYFEVVCAIDDLRFIRDQHPELFRFYQEYGSVFHVSSLTDTAIPRHLTILANEEVKPKGIREVSISEYYMSTVNVPKMLDMLSKMLAKSPILLIKAILAQNSTNPKAANELVAWCQDNGVPIEKQFEHNTDKAMSNSVLTGLPDSRRDIASGFTESSTYSETFGEIFPVQSELLFLMYDGFYSELKSATREDRSTPFAMLRDFDDPVQFLPKILESKLVDYRRYTELIQDKNNPYYKYFKWVTDNLIVNHDFNFVPRVAFKNYSAYYKRLVETGQMTDTPYGLVKPNSENIAPIFSFKTS